MAKKEPTEKQLAARKAASERMKARHAALKEQNPATEKAAPSDAASVQPVPGVTLTNEQFAALLERFAGMANETPKPKSTRLEITERFSTRSGEYKDPTEALYNIPELSRYNLRENFVIDYAFSTIQYETRQGEWFVEPKFELTLKRRQFDPEDPDKELVRYDERGNPFNPRIVLGRATFFLDPPSDIAEARLAGLDRDDMTDEEFRDAMMMYRFKRWIMERVQPVRAKATSRSKKEEVIGGQVYEIEEYSQVI